MGRACPLAFLVGLLAAGCGGGGRLGIRSTGGNFSVRFAWPTKAGRVIPTAAQSIRVQVLKNSTVTHESFLTPGAPVANFTEVPTGTVTVKAVAYPTAGGTGTALASAQTTQAITANGTASVSLTMASTIDHLTLSPNPVNLALTGIVTRQTTVTAYDTAGSVVLTAPADLTYTSSGLSIFIVNPTGMVTGLAVGNATLTVTDAVSGKSDGAPVHVTL